MFLAVNKMILLTWRSREARQQLTPSEVREIGPNGTRRLASHSVCWLGLVGREGGIGGKTGGGRAGRGSSKIAREIDLVTSKSDST